MKPIDDPNGQSVREPGPTHASGSELPTGVAAPCRPNDALVKAIIRAAEEHYEEQNLAAARGVTPQSASFTIP